MNSNDWKRAASLPIGDKWEIRECDAEDGCSVIECYSPGVSEPIKDIHVPDHLIPALILALKVRLDEVDPD